MGTIVGAFCTSHILMSRAGVEEASDRVVAGMKEIQQRLEAIAPDIVVIVSSDHMFNIGPQLEPPFTIVAAPNFSPLGDLGLPTDLEFPGHPGFAEGLAAYAAGEGFDLAILRGYRPDHGVTIPAMLGANGRAVAIVPLLININMTPSPIPKRCFKLGETLRGFVEKARPAGERVALLGAGGLSHWLAIARHGEVSRSFDEEVLNLFSEGNAAQIAERSAEEIVEAGGNGGLEIVNWLTVAGAVPGARARRIYYEPIAEWMTGMAGVELVLP